MGKRLSVWFFLAGAALLCCACGGSLTSVKDANCVVAKDLAGKEGQGPDITIDVPRKRPSGGLGLAVVNLAAGNLASAAVFGGGSLLGGPGFYGPMRIDGYFTYKKHRYITIYSKVPGKPEWDLIAETNKRIKAKPIPASESCVFEGAGAFSSPPFIQEYSGTDGTVKLGRFMGTAVHFSPRNDAKVPCDKETAKVYSDYLREINNDMRTMVEEYERTNPPTCNGSI